MKIASSILLAGAAGAAFAAAPPPAKPVPSATLAAASAASPRRFPGVSDEGNAVLAKAQTTPDPQLVTLNRQMRAAHDQLITAVMAPVIDVDKVTTAVRAEETAQAAVRTHNNDRLLAVLKQLPDGDRGTFLRTLVLSRQAKPAAAPAATPQP